MWHIKPGGHDPRQIDLLAVVAMLILIVAIDHYLSDHSNKHLTAGFIEPSQSVRW